MNFSPDALLLQLDFPAATRRVVVAFSGGLDSTVLLHALAARRHALPGPLLAVHVDHSLHPESPDWAAHAQEVADHLDVEFVSMTIDATPVKGDSLEATARDRRYAAISELLREGDCLVTAQHADDQAETFLLQALRGAGVDGLAAMPARKPFGPAELHRPLLAWTRADLEAWARDEGIDWLEDPSNANTDFDRNLLRLEVIPRLRERWPGLARTLSRSARRSAEASELLEALTDEGLAGNIGSDGALQLENLGSLESSRQRLILRGWLADQGVRRPSETVLEQLRGLLNERADAESEIRWGDYVVRRHRKELHAEREVGAAPASGLWSLDAGFELGSGLGRLHRRAAGGPGLDPELVTLDVRYREGGERFQPPGRPRKELKKLLQEAGIPRWQRRIIPLLYGGDELLAVGDLWIAESAHVDDGWQPVWEDSPLRPDKILDQDD